SRRGASWRACRGSREGRAPPWSMTTRRRRLPGPPPPRGRSGRFGLLPPLAMADTSVEAPQFRPYAEPLSQDTREHPALCGTVEARQVTARVGAAARLVPAGHENAFSGREAEQIALRRVPAAACAASRGLVPYDSSSVTTGSSSSESRSASSWCAATPQYFEPGNAAFGQRLPLERIAPQRPE